MSWWIAILFALPLPIFLALHLIDHRKRHGNPDRAADPPAIIYGRLSPSFVLGTAGRSYEETPFQHTVLETHTSFNRTGEELSGIFGLSMLLARLFLFLVLMPPRLIYWAGAARTWRPLALLAAFFLTPVSLIAWFFQIGASEEASQTALAFAWDAGFTAAVEVPLLIVIGAWPWWRWRGLPAGLFSAAVLTTWLVYLLPSPA